MEQITKYEDNENTNNDIREITEISNKWDFISFTRHTYNVTLEDDRQLRIRNIIINVISWITIILGIVILQLGYSESRGYYDDFAAEIIKVVINILSLILAGFLIEYRIKNVKIDLRKWQKEQLPFTLRTHASKENLSFLVAELIVILPQPIPWVPKVDKLALLLILRLVFIGRLIRDNHPLYKQRREIWKDARLLYCQNPDTFNTFTVFRMTFKQHTSIYVFGICLFAVLYSAYSFYVSDRGKEDEPLIWFDWIYLTVITAATVGYGDISPQSYIGKLVAMVTAIAGVVLTAFLVGVISSSLNPTDFQKEAGTWLTIHKQRKERENLSAKFIQLVYRHYRERKKYICPRPAKQEKAYTRKCIACVNRLRAMRKEEQWTKISAANPLQWQIQELEGKLSSVQSELKATNAKLDKLIRALLPEESATSSSPNTTDTQVSPQSPIYSNLPSGGGSPK